jgi:integron integrase
MGRIVLRPGGPGQPPRLLDQVRDIMRQKHYSIRTEETYIQWIRRFILFHGKRHPRDMASQELGQFLSHLAVEREVAASTQNQALNAIVFLYREVLKQEVGQLGDVVRARQPTRLPLVLTRNEVHALLTRLDGVVRIMASLLYGSGLRLMECVRLRVKDLEFERREVTVRDGKGEKDRVTMLPATLVDPLRERLARTQALHAEDLADGLGNVYLPYALERKYPNASREWCWQWVFPSRRRSLDPRSGIERRHHVAETALQRAVKDAVRSAGIEKPASCHTLRH